MVRREGTLRFSLRLDATMLVWQWHPRPLEIGAVERYKDMEITVALWQPWDPVGCSEQGSPGAHCLRSCVAPLHEFSLSVMLD